MRFQVLGNLLGGHPLVILIFVAWAALGVWVAWRFRPWPVRIAYLVVHLAPVRAPGQPGFLGRQPPQRFVAGEHGRHGHYPGSLFRQLCQSLGAGAVRPLFPHLHHHERGHAAAHRSDHGAGGLCFCAATLPGKDLLFMAFLATMMIPSEVLLIPNFITITSLGWKNTYAALIVPFAVSVVTVFFLRQFFLSIPNDLFDAATIDGCGHVRFMLSIAMPLARPALVSTGMFNFLSAWNSLLWPLLVTDHERMRPIALGLASFSSEAGMQAQLYMAAATFTIVPIIVLFLFVQRQFIEGIARSGIK